MWNHRFLTDGRKPGILIRILSWLIGHDMPISVAQIQKYDIISWNYNTNKVYIVAYQSKFAMFFWYHFLSIVRGVTKSHKDLLSNQNPRIRIHPFTCHLTMHFVASINVFKSFSRILELCNVCINLYHSKKFFNERYTFGKGLRKIDILSNLSKLDSTYSKKL